MKTCSIPLQFDNLMMLEVNVIDSVPWSTPPHTAFAGKHLTVNCYSHTAFVMENKRFQLTKY